MLCNTDAHPAAWADGLVVLVCAGPVEQHLVVRELEVHLPFPRWSRESRPMRTVYHVDKASSIANRLIAGNPVLFEVFKGSRLP